VSIEARPSDEFAALLGGAVTLSRVGDRVAAIAALLSAVGLAPDDLTAHRRLAAAYAVAGDRECARREYDRFIARLERRGALDAAAIERSYAAMLFSPQPSPQRAIKLFVFGALVVRLAFPWATDSSWLDWPIFVGGMLVVAVAIGVGGAYDYLTGRVPRAPAWMRRAGLEWLFRLVRQPWRIRRMAVLPLYALRVLRSS